MSYNIGDIFANDEEYSKRAEWCNNNDCYIQEIEPLEDGTRQYTIKIVEHGEDEAIQRQIYELEQQQEELKKLYIEALINGDTETAEEIKQMYGELE